MPPRVLCVGHVALDHMFVVEALPVRPVKTPARAHRAVVGGMGANAAVAAARLGAAVRFAGPAGDDASAALFAAHFEREGIDATRLVRVAGASSSVSAVVVDAQGERLIVSHRGSALQAAPPLDPAWLDDAELLLADPRCPAWAAAALAAARARDLPSVLDADAAPRDDLRRLAGRARWAAFSQPGLAAFADGTPEDALAQALARGAEVALATFGELGLIWQRAGQPPRRLAAFRVGPVVDTTAAGDVFHGALAVALAERLGDETALRFASAAAALKCLQPGGAAGAPRREEVERFLAAQAREETPP
jgi:sulfofructose kinase